MGDRRQVADALAPGEIAKPEVFHRPVHPEDNTSLRLNVAGAQEALSLSFTLTVKFTGVPAVTNELCKGDTEIVGFDRVQVPAPNVT